MFSDREGTKKAWPESTLGEDERSGGDENAAETVEEEWLARDEGEQLLSRSVKACDAFGKENEAGVEWSSMQLDLINSLGQAQHLILAPTKFVVSNPDFFNIEKRLIKVISEKKHKLVGFGWAQKKVDLTFNPMGQAHRFIITPTIFTNSGGVLQVEKEINQKKLMGFDGAQNSDLSMNFKVIEKAFGTVGAPKIEVENMKILFPTNTNILKRCKVKEGDVSVLIIMESPFVREWDPGGCIRDGWNLSGIKGDENLQESATSAMKCHEIQTHQYHEEEIVTYIENMLRLESGAIGEIVWGTRLPVIVDRLIELDVQLVWEGNLQEDADGIVEMELEEVLNFLHLEFCQSSGWLAVAYLASYLPRAKFLSAALVANIIQRRSLMDVPRLEFQLLNKPMEPIWKHKSSPLKVCLPTAVEELLRRAKAAQRFMASEVFLNSQQIINLVGNYGGATTSSKMLKDDVIKVAPFDNVERWLQSRINKIVLVFEYMSSSTLRSWILYERTTKSLNVAQVIRAASVSAHKGRLILLVGMIPGMYSNRAIDPGGGLSISSIIWSLCFKLWDPRKTVKSVILSIPSP